MQTDEQYDDLTTLFAAQDDVLQSDAFVESVMTGVNRRARWRVPFLFGAAGFGLGASLSQIGGLLDAVAARTPRIDVSVDTLQSAQLSFQASSIWIVGAVAVLASCVAVLVTERA